MFKKDAFLFFARHNGWLKEGEYLPLFRYVSLAMLVCKWMPHILCVSSVTHMAYKKCSRDLLRYGFVHWLWNWTKSNNYASLRDNYLQFKAINIGRGRIYKNPKRFFWQNMFTIIFCSEFSDPDHHAGSAWWRNHHCSPGVHVLLLQVWELWVSML